MSSAEDRIEILPHEEWLRSLETRVAETKWEGWRTDGPTIFKVPRIFQVAESEANVPKMVSLGPYHHGKEQLKAMEDLKWHYLKKFLGRNPDKTLKDYIKQIKEKEPQARMAYSEKVDKTSDEFAQMMLLDCCFVIEILHLWKPCVERREKEEAAEEEAVDKQIRSAKPWFRAARLMQSPIPRGARQMHSSIPSGARSMPSPMLENLLNTDEKGTASRQMHSPMLENQLNTDEKGTETVQNPFTSTRYTLTTVARDMLMLENQLPFFLLQTLFDSAYPDQPDLLKRHALEFLGETIMNREIKLTPGIGDVYHLLHLIHSSISPPENNRDDGEPFGFCWPLQSMKRSRHLPKDDPEGTDHQTRQLKWIPSATQLMEAGVHFRKKEKATNFLDITFHNGVMEIALLQVDDSTETFLRNLIAFEQCYKKITLHVTAYAKLMDCIINTAADVALLQQHGIILSGLGDGKQVANLFNKLCKEVTLDYGNAYVSDIYKDVNEHCDTKYNQWRARLNRDYFSNPWAIISVFAAILLFVLAITETIFSVLSYSYVVYFGGHSHRSEETLLLAHDRVVSSHYEFLGSFLGR
ncbi:UPF0481 protein [Musa troglodytarum]|uniref:UPF0481 protein n=1 Tax=Musa troglodytarum TaxID=320322 RepID=A0A9E7FNN8_9LILI|nr:UPF0481 protein [Musa troglodytarum]